MSSETRQMELTIREPAGEQLVLVMPRSVSTSLGKWVALCPEPMSMWFRMGETHIQSTIDMPPDAVVSAEPTP